MKYLIGAALAALCVSAQAEIVGVAEMGDVRLEFHDTSPLWCADGAPSSALRLDYVAPGGAVTRGCYIVTPDDVVLFVLEDGRAGSGPKSAIKPPKRV